MYKMLSCTEPITKCFVIRAVYEKNRSKNGKRMKKKIKPTESELQILKVLWENGPSTVKDINRVLSKKKETGYTTTLKLMQIMFEKGLLSRVAEGRSHIYSTKVKQNETQKVMVDKLLETMFGGSAKDLVMQALGNSKASKSELGEIRNLIDELEGKE